MCSYWTLGNNKHIINRLLLCLLSNSTGQFGIVHKANMMSKVNGINKYRDVAVKSFKGKEYLHLLLVLKATSICSE